MKNKIILPVLILFSLQCLPFIMNGQVTTFEQVYPTAQNQNGADVLATSDGGYLIVGTTVNSTANDSDLIIMKTDNLGNTLWTKIYSGTGNLNPAGMLQAADGNYFIVGYEQSSGGTSEEIYLLKIDPSGNSIWTKTYGSFGNDHGDQIVATSDGNYVIVGGSNNNACLIKIDVAGNIIWTQYYAGLGFASARSVALCLDGGFILAGATSTAYSGTNDSNYVVKTNSSGGVIWSKTYGGPNSYQGKFILANSDGTYTLCVDDSSQARDSDIRVMQISSTGTILWNTMYGGLQKDISKMIQPTTDGGYILVGISRSFGWINPYMWILKFNSTGDTTWSKRFGSWYHNHGYAVRQTADGGYVSVGHEIDASAVAHILLVKMDAGGAASVQEFAINNSLGIYPNPSANGIVNIDLGGDNTASIFKIRNELGQEIFSEKIETSNQSKTKMIDIGNKAPGIYFVTIQSEKYLTTKKIILK